MNNSILIVDDDVQIRKMLLIILEASGFKVEVSVSGLQALRMCASVKPDLVLLDLMLPDIDGLDVIKEIRSWSQVPIVVLSGHSDDAIVVEAFNRGCEDFITKPFNSEVLVARIKTHLRKAVIQETGDSEIKNGPIRMDLIGHEVYLNGEKIPLTPKEYELLRYFIVNRGKMLTHKQILKDVWGAGHTNDTQYVRVYIGQLRNKFEADPNKPQIIVTEPGIGYRMENGA